MKSAAETAVAGMKPHFSRPVTLTIHGEDANQVRQVLFVTGTGGARTANLLFFPGFNTVSSSDGRSPEHPLLNQRVLSGTGKGKLPVNHVDAGVAYLRAQAKEDPSYSSAMMLVPFGMAIVSMRA